MGTETLLAQRLRQILKSRRAALKLRQEDVAILAAEHLGKASLTKQAISQWENAQTQAGVDELDAWARALGMRLRVDIYDAEDQRAGVMVDPPLVESVMRMNDLSGEDREIVIGIVKRLSRHDTVSR